MPIIKESEVYRRLKLIGEGTYGKAFLVESLCDGQLFVIKQMDLQFMSDEEKKIAYQEASILSQLKHPNIVNFQEVYKTNKGRLCIVMDYADGGDMSQKIKSFQKNEIPEQQILDWFTQMCLAMKHVHDRKIVHRDFKTQNIFLTKDGRVKLGDFGISKVLSHTREQIQTVVGTPYYLAPELIESQPYSFSSDVWSLGVVLYELCTRKTPFDADNLPMLALKIVRGQYQAIPQHYSKELKNQSFESELDLETNYFTNFEYIFCKTIELPIITNRIKKFLSETIRISEFDHTILHNQNILSNPMITIKTMDDEEKIKNPPLNQGSASSSEKKIQQPTPNQLLKKQNDGLHFPEIKFQIQSPQVKHIIIRAPNSRNIGIFFDKKVNDEVSNQRYKVKLPEIKVNSQPKQTSQELNTIVRQASRGSKYLTDIIKNNNGQSDASESQKKIANTPLQVVRNLRKNSDDHDPDLTKDTKRSCSPVVQRRFFEQLIPKLGDNVQSNNPQLKQQRGQSAMCPNNSPSVHNIYQREIPAIQQRQANIPKLNNSFEWDEERDISPRSQAVKQIKIPKTNYRIRIGKKHCEKMVRSNDAEDRSSRQETSIHIMSKSKEKYDPADTLQDISEHNSDCRSPSIKKFLHEVNKDNQQYSLQKIESNEELLVDNTLANFSLTKSQIIGNICYQPNNITKIASAEQIQPSDEKAEMKKRKIIFKDPFGKLGIVVPQTKSIKLRKKKFNKEDSEDDLQQMLNELQGLVQAENVNLQEQLLVPQPHLLLSYDDSSEDIKVQPKQKSTKLAHYDDIVHETLEYINGNQEIQHLKRKLKNKLNKHFDLIYDLAKQVANSEDLGKELVTNKIQELIPYSDLNSAQGVATLIVTLVLLAKGEVIKAL